MKKFKIFDVWFSILLIAGFTVASLIRLDYSFLIGYFVVGGWQIISMVIHGANSWFTGSRNGRFTYHWIVAMIALITLIGLIFQAMLVIVLFPLLFAAPFMATWYTCLCYREVYIKMQRPLAMLK